MGEETEKALEAKSDLTNGMTRKAPLEDLNVGSADWKNLLAFGDDRFRIRIPDHFSTSLIIADREIEDFRRFIRIFLTQTSGDFNDTAKWLTPTR